MSHVNKPIISPYKTCFESFIARDDVNLSVQNKPAIARGTHDGNEYITSSSGIDSRTTWAPLHEEAKGGLGQSSSGEVR